MTYDKAILLAHKAYLEQQLAEHKSYRDELESESAKTAVNLAKAEKALAELNANLANLP